MARRPDASWAGKYPGADEDGVRRARHLKVDSVVFIPEEPGAASSGLATFGIILIILGVITAGAAFGFSISVPEFPSVAVLPMVGGGVAILALGILLLVVHRMKTKERSEQVPLDGVYLFDDALIVRRGEDARVFGKDSIKAIGVDVAVAGASGPVGGPGGAMESHRSQLSYVTEDGSEATYTLQLYPYPMWPEPPMNPILIDWLG